MQCVHRSIASALVAGALAIASSGAMADGAASRSLYSLTSPPLLQEPDLAPMKNLLSLGPWQLASAGSSNGGGLTLQTGSWFARAGVGHSLDNDAWSVGGGYRFTDSQAVSMHLTRQLGQEGLGLAVRYDWDARTYLRVGYEAPQRITNRSDTLRFSAGVRF